MLVPHDICAIRLWLLHKKEELRQQQQQQQLQQQCLQGITTHACDSDVEMVGEELAPCWKPVLVAGSAAGAEIGAGAGAGVVAAAVGAGAGSGMAGVAWPGPAPKRRKGTGKSGAAVKRLRSRSGTFISSGGVAGGGGVAAQPGGWLAGVESWAAVEADRIGGWVLPLMTATDVVPPGRDLSYSYGNSYWEIGASVGDTLVLALDCAKANRRADRLEEEVERLRRLVAGELEGREGQREGRVRGQAEGQSEGGEGGGIERARRDVQGREHVEMEDRVRREVEERVRREVEERVQREVEDRVRREVELLQLLTSAPATAPAPQLSHDAKPARAAADAPAVTAPLLLPRFSGSARAAADAPAASASAPAPSLPHGIRPARATAAASAAPAPAPASTSAPAPPAPTLGHPCKAQHREPSAGGHAQHVQASEQGVEAGQHSTVVAGGEPEGYAARGASIFQLVIDADLDDLERLALEGLGEGGDGDGSDVLPTLQRLQQRGLNPEPSSEGLKQWQGGGSAALVCKEQTAAGGLLAGLRAGAVGSERGGRGGGSGGGSSGGGSKGEGSREEDSRGEGSSRQEESGGGASSVPTSAAMLQAKPHAGAPARQGNFSLIARQLGQPPSVLSEALWKACRAGRAKELALLLRCPGVDVNAVAAAAPNAVAAAGSNAEGTRDRGKTGLHLAVEAGHVAVVSLLLSQPGIDVNARDCRGQTPLVALACGGGAQAMGSKAGGGLPGAGAGAVSGSGLQGVPGAAAVAAGPVSGAAKAVTQPGATAATAATAAADATAATGAAEAAEAAIAALLLSHPRVDPNAPDAVGGTALYYACRRGAAALVRQLLGHPATDANRRGVRGAFTPLMEAASQGHTSVAAALLHHPGVQVGAVAATPPVAAAATAAPRSREGTPEILVTAAAAAAAAAPSVAPQASQAAPSRAAAAAPAPAFTALHLACMKGHTGVVQLLLQHSTAGGTYSHERMASMAKGSSLAGGAGGCREEVEEGRDVDNVDAASDGGRPAAGQLGQQGSGAAVGQVSGLGRADVASALVLAKALGNAAVAALLEQHLSGAAGT